MNPLQVEARVSGLEAVGLRGVQAVQASATTAPGREASPQALLALMAAVAAAPGPGEDRTLPPPPNAIPA